MAQYNGGWANPCSPEGVCDRGYVMAGNILAGNSCRNYHRSRDRIKNTKRPFNLYAHLNFTRINEANLHERKVKYFGDGICRAGNIAGLNKPLHCKPYRNLERTSDLNTDSETKFN